MRELADHILDIARNGIEAGATRLLLLVQEFASRDLLRIVVVDNGRGMDEETRRRVLDPFYTTRTTRKWGLGVPLFSQTCKRCAGVLQIRSKSGLGTWVQAEMALSHLDRPPLGSLGSVVAILACDAPRVVLRCRHRTESGAFELDTGELQAELEEVPISEPSVLRWLARHVDDEVRSIDSRA